MDRVSKELYEDLPAKVAKSMLTFSDERSMVNVCIMFYPPKLRRVGQ